MFDRCCMLIFYFHRKVFQFCPLPCFERGLHLGCVVIFLICQEKMSVIFFYLTKLKENRLLFFQLQKKLKKFNDGC